MFCWCFILQLYFSDFCSGVATGWTGVDMSTPLLLEVAPEMIQIQRVFTVGG